MDYFKIVEALEAACWLGADILGCLAALVLGYSILGAAIPRVPTDHNRPWTRWDTLILFTLVVMLSAAIRLLWIVSGWVYNLVVFFLF